MLPPRQSHKRKERNGCITAQYYTFRTNFHDQILIKVKQNIIMLYMKDYKKGVLIDLITIITLW